MSGKIMNRSNSNNRRNNINNNNVVIELKSSRVISINARILDSKYNIFNKYSIERIFIFYESQLEFDIFLNRTFGNITTKAIVNEEQMFLEFMRSVIKKFKISDKKSYNCNIYFYSLTPLKAMNISTVFWYCDLFIRIAGIILRQVTKSKDMTVDLIMPSHGVIDSFTEFIIKCKDSYDVMMLNKLLDNGLININYISKDADYIEINEPKELPIL